MPPLRLAILGFIPGNYHPYSWSAIINGYDRDLMDRCPAKVIPAYLNRQPPDRVGTLDARVTHIWTDDPEETKRVAAAALIPSIVSKPEEVIGQVDAAIIAIDDGDDHVSRARPFVEAGLPVFVDKPLATNIADLAQFVSWRKRGCKIVSSSGLRYSPELEVLRGKEWRWITGSTCKGWKRYGIHVLEPIFTLVGAGFVSAQALVSGGTTLVQARHDTGTVVSIAAIEEGFGSAFVLHGYADDEHRTVELRDTFSAFRGQLLAFIEYIRGEKPEPHPFDHTLELMCVVIAGLESARAGGREVTIAEIRAQVDQLLEP